VLETPFADLEAPGLLSALDEAHIGKYHLRAALTTGVGFFTDAYDLFVIGAVLTILKGQWHLSPTGVSLVGSAALLAAFFGAFVFGRIADVFGRRRVYGLEAAIMVVGAIGSALAPDVVWLVVFRFVIGVGIGGDYPVSAVLMSEYANRRDRGKLVGLVFSMQALGLIVGPLVGIALVASHVPAPLTWRLMLGLGAIPAAAVIVARRRLPESPRFKAEVQGRAAEAAAELERLSRGTLRLARQPSSPVPTGTRLSLGAFVRDRRLALTLLGTAGTWFLFDYAYYGNSISTPVILRMVAPGASLLTTLTWTLGIFAVAALPGYLLAAFTMDRIGHRRLQLIGFGVMAAAFLTIGVVPEVAAATLPFLGVYGVSYFFSEFGPNTTTFVMASEVFPISLRTTGHGISAGIAKVGAFIGVFVFPLLAASLGLRGTLTLTAGLALAGLGLTLVLPEPARRSLEEVSGHPVASSPTFATRTLGNFDPGRTKIAQSTE
jgi:PHS family inorganic phosphate transporter-like MFS transporter